jgi:hypothetical protein
MKKTENIRVKLEFNRNAIEFIFKIKIAIKDLIEQIEMIWKLTYFDTFFVINKTTAITLKNEEGSHALQRTPHVILSYAMTGCPPLLLLINTGRQSRKVGKKKEKKREKGERKKTNRATTKRKNQNQ